MQTFEDHGLRGGLWRGRLQATDGPPQRIVLVQHGEVLAEARLSRDGDDAWLVEIDLPREILTEGVQTLLLRTDAAGAGEGIHPDGEVLARLPLLAGRMLDADLTAEIATLRAELELVKRELRRFASGQ